MTRVFLERNGSFVGLWAKCITSPPVTLITATNQLLAAAWFERGPERDTAISPSLGTTGSRITPGCVNLSVSRDSISDSVLDSEPFLIQHRFSLQYVGGWFKDLLQPTGCWERRCGKWWRESRAKRVYDYVVSMFEKVKAIHKGEPKTKGKNLSPKYRFSELVNRFRICNSYMNQFPPSLYIYIDIYILNTSVWTMLTLRERSSLTQL